MALAISRAYGGTCLPQRITPLLWPYCAFCKGKQAMTICRVCGGLGRIPVLA